MKNKLLAPQAKKEKHIHKKFDDQIVDHYHWLKKRNDPKVLDYLQQENKYAKQKLSALEPLQKKLFTDMKSRLPQKQDQEPVPTGNYFYYNTWKKENQYPIYKRRIKNSTEEETLLDANSFANKPKYLDISALKISPNHKILAYAEDQEGREFYNIYFKDLKTGKKLPNFISEVSSVFVWANDNKTLFYIQQDKHTFRNHQVYRYDITTGEKTFIYEEPDEQFSVYLDKTLCKTWIQIVIISTQTTEYRYLNANKILENFKIFCKREKGHEYHFHCGETVFYILTNKDQAFNFKLMTIPKNSEALNKESSYPNSLWKECIPHRADSFIEDYQVFKDFIAFQIRKNCKEAIEIYNIKSSQLEIIDFKENIYSVKVADNLEYQTDFLRLNFQTPVTPLTVYDYNWSEKKLLFKSQHKYSGDFSSKDYKTEFLFATSKDGTKVPISVLYKRDTQLKASTPLLLYGYGSYGYSLDPVFNPAILSLLKHGFVYAMAHVRGGSEGGRKWYEKGRLLNKKNSFSDFISCAEFLIKKSYTSSKHLYIMGESAGGLLMGAVLNERPDLFRAVIARVPFVDCLATMLDKTIPLSTGEYEEWGNPNEKVYYDYIKSYSPYNNIKKTGYPYLLIETGYYDPRVQYWEPAKWLAKLRENNTNNQLMTMIMNMKSGHFGSTGRLEYLKLRALCYSFLIGIEKNLI